MKLILNSGSVRSTCISSPISLEPHYKIKSESHCLVAYHVTWVGALSASSTTSTWPAFTAFTSGESSYTITPSRTVGDSVRLWK